MFTLPIISYVIVTIPAKNPLVRRVVSLIRVTPFAFNMVGIAALPGATTLTYKIAFVG